MERVAPDRSITLGGVTISFQRFPLPPGGIVGRRPPPPSHGSLPLGRVRGGWLLPVAEGEAFWIGLGPAAPAGPAARVAVAVRVGGRRGARDGPSGRPWPGAAVVVPPHRWLYGLARGGDRIAAFHRTAAAGTPACRRLRFVSADAEAVVWPVGYARFARATGVAPPGRLDPDAAYRGWRLP